MPDHTHAPEGVDGVPRSRAQALATGTAVIAVGLGITGLCTLVMLALGARYMPGEAYADLVVWWTAATLLGLAFGVFEVYLARLVIAERSSGRPAAPVTGLMVGRALLLAAVVTTGILALAPVVAGRLFGGDLGPVLLLPVFMTLTAMQSLQRGVATGRHDMTAIAIQLTLDGIGRAVATALLLILGTDSVTALAAGCCGAVAGSLLAGRLRLGPWMARPRLRGREVRITPVLLLLVGAVGPLLATNGPVPWLRSVDAVGPHVLGAFAGALTLSRIPTQFVSAAMGPLLAHLSDCVERNDPAGFRHVMRQAGGLAVALGAAFVVVFALLGQWMLQILLGPAFRLGTATLAVLAAASSVMFLTVVLQAALGAHGRWERVAQAWIAGAVAFCLVLLVPGDAVWRATLAPLAGVTAALVGMWTSGRSSWKARSDRRTG